MSVELGRLESDPLFLALTRPTMVFGVTYAWLMLEMLIGMVYFINTSDFMVVIYAGTIHMVGIMICSKEPRFIEIMMVWAQTSTKCTNKRYHSNTSSYDLY